MALAKDKKKKQNQNAENGVVITVYVESSRTRSSNKSSKDQTKKTKQQVESKTTCGYDRKAQLLAYSRYLRKIEASQNVEAQSQPKIKMKLKSMLKKLSCKEIKW